MRKLASLASSVVLCLGIAMPAQAVSLSPADILNSVVVSPSELSQVDKSEAFLLAEDLTASSFCPGSRLLKSVTYQVIYPSISAPGLTAEGVLNSGITKGSRSGLICERYKMNFAVAGWVIQSDLPCIRNLVSGDGSWSYDLVCGP